MAQRGDPDALPAPHQLDRHPRAEPRLPRARRPLHEQVAPVEARRRLARATRRAAPAAAAARGSRPAPDTAPAPCANRSTASRCTYVPSGVGGISARGSGSSSRFRLAAQPDEAVLVVDRDVVAPSPSPGRRRRRRSCAPAAGTRTCTRTTARPRLSLDELEPADRLGALDQLVLVELEVVEVGPPLRLLLAPVVLEQVREQPARLALLRAREQLRLDPRALLEPLLRLLLDLARLGRLPPLDLRRAQARAASGAARTASGSRPRCRRGSPRGSRPRAPRATPRTRPPRRPRRASPPRARSRRTPRPP